MAKQHIKPKNEATSSQKRLGGEEDSTTLRDMAARHRSTKESSPFVFNLEAFEKWLATKGYILPTYERLYWKRIAGGRGRISTVVRQSDKARIDRLGIGGLSRTDARAQLYEAFRSSNSPDSLRTDSLYIRPAAHALGLLRQPPSKGTPNSKKQEFDVRASGDLELPDRTPTSEGPIARRRITEDFQDVSARPKSKLPSHPKTWSYDFRGKPEGEKDRALLAFLDEVYGSYLPEHANEMRDYLRNNDPKLFSAIRAFGFEKLPEKFRMPSTREKVRERIARAALGEYERMAPSERKSVRTATQRKPRPKN